jgi:hypothetical protein
VHLLRQRRKKVATATPLTTLAPTEKPTAFMAVHHSTRNKAQALDSWRLTGPNQRGWAGTKIKIQVFLSWRLQLGQSGHFGLRSKMSGRQFRVCHACDPNIVSSPTLLTLNELDLSLHRFLHHYPEGSAKAEGELIYIYLLRYIIHNIDIL